jgi:hypothetical protein
MRPNAAFAKDGPLDAHEPRRTECAADSGADGVLGEGITRAPLHAPSKGARNHPSATLALAEIVSKATGGSKGIHPATRTFRRYVSM